MKYTQEQLNKMEAVEIYKLLLAGYIKKFPNGFWQNPEAPQNSIKVIKFLFENILKWNDEEIKNKLSHNLFVKYKLRGMLTLLYNYSPTDAFLTTYPNRFHIWEFARTPRDYWNLETSKQATKWLIEEKLKWTDEDIKNKLTNRFLIKNNFSGMLSEVFNNSTFLVIDNAYPNKFKPWELSTVPKHFWNKETAGKATRWLIEEKLKWSDEDIKNKLINDTFINNNLGGMLVTVFNSTTFKALDNAYPNKFKEEDLKKYSRVNSLKNI